MALLVSDIISGAQLLLNDVNASIHTTAKLLPYVKHAYKELENIIRDNGYTYSKKTTTGTVVAGATTITPPNDILNPVDLFERAVGEDNDHWVEMLEKEWEPNKTQADKLEYWTWRQLTINLIGATVNREYKLRYWSVFPAISAAGDTVQVIDAQAYMSSRVAALVAQFQMKDVDRYNKLMAEAGPQLEVILSLVVKKNQSLPARPRPFRAFPNRRL